MAILKRVGGNFWNLEHLARSTMCVAAVIAGSAGLAVEAGLIRSFAVYDRLSWYSVGEVGNLTVTRQFDDETTCRQQETLQSVCYSGDVLSHQANVVFDRK
ncbi:MAG: hypothetical protein V4695_12625 [Pseudomonadota bacterium]